MAKEKTESKEERRARKSEKSKSTLNDAGVTKKKSKKDKKEPERTALAERALNEVQKQEGNDDPKKSKLANRPVGALVPFAHPLADEKVEKKCFKAVKRAAGQRTLKRGVKEVVKALRKSPTNAPPSSLSEVSDPIGVVILAADISPMDVISHIPVLCEDHNIPYIFVTSRAELGMAGQTKRPTSVVMVVRDKGKKAEKDDGEEEWSETYKGLVKTVMREAPQVRK